MTRNEMILFIQLNPNVPVAHISFSEEEYIYMSYDRKVYDENKYLFEDWNSRNANGIRIRAGGEWEDDWYIKKG